MDYTEKIKNSLGSNPKHIAVIMDGNGRWASKNSLARIEGHKQGAKTVAKIVEYCRKYQVKHLTLFSFSTENWQRSQEEVKNLMELFKFYLESELNNLIKNKIKLRAIGDLRKLPLAVRKALEITEQKTKKNTELELILAISYGGREEIVNSTKAIVEQVQSGKLKVEHIDNQVFQENLWTKDIPDPDLLIRTSGELRISNFLLWQLAYAEIVVIPELWPDFNEEIFLRCLNQYKSRERRYGLTSEQLKEITEEETNKIAKAS